MPTTVWPVRKRPTCSLPCCQVAKDDNGKKLRMKYLVAKDKGVYKDYQKLLATTSFCGYLDIIHSLKNLMAPIILLMGNSACV